MDTGVFFGRIRADTNIDAPSRLYFSSEYYYPNDIDFMVNWGVSPLDPDQYTMTKGDNFVEVQLTNPALSGLIVEFHIKPL